MRDALRLGFSTCPNDTFMFEALTHGRIPQPVKEFDISMADIEELNRLAIENQPDISKISLGVFPEIIKHYRILNSGSALGFKNGPLIVSRRKIYPDELSDVEIAIPGMHTTANFLLSILFPEVKHKKVCLFSDIEEMVMDGGADVGLIIHESRFTYQNRGLKLVADLGETWEEKYNKPVPLGVIVIKRTLSDELQQKIDKSISESIKFAFKNPELSRKFIKDNSRELDDDVINKHIDLYVNDFSVRLGEKGREAILFFLSKTGLLDGKLALEENIFVPE